MTGDLTVVGKGGRDVFVGEILRPSFELLRRLADLAVEKCQGVAETVWIGAGVASVRLPGNGF